MAEASNYRATDEEEEEDYMGDLSLFLPPVNSPPSKDSSKKVPDTKTPFISEPSKKKSKTLKGWQEQRRQEREKKQRDEDEQTLAKLEWAIPQSNIGFRMLKQMGYTPGSALGKEGVGRAEPVGLEIRRSRAGIGREDPHKEKKRKEEENFERKRRKEEENVETKRRKEEELMAEFGSRQKSQWRSRRVVVNYHKARGALAQLDNEEVLEPEKEDDEECEQDEEEEEITEEDLQEILTKLRNEHYYCLFCGCQYESMEALLNNCPGINEDDH
ncbi:uncharacterized protein LOC131167681 [Malania oleifera]|uniref:uncharacterized protein LOC131167681 n=1 Tax=Malania oleifera TaxID=397392 RepID=UPI0025ADDB34|nr:uncharacterized protein LOC131167681 [Malania oleifera]